jgi:hypothetical protein
MLILNKYKGNKVFITIDVYCFELNTLEGHILHTVFYGNDKLASLNTN